MWRKYQFTFAGIVWTVRPRGWRLFVPRYWKACWFFAWYMKKYGIVELRRVLEG